DFYKETVAVVTNPAIDRERETEAFATKTLIGVRPALNRVPDPDDLLVVLETPLLAGGHPDLGDESLAHEVAAALGTLTVDELLAQFAPRVGWLALCVREGENVSQALDRLVDEAIGAVRDGVQCLVLDDSELFEQRAGWLDPHLATAVIDRALREAASDENLRRRAGLVVRSASIRTLHDIALLCGFGADAINPYAMLLASVGAHKPPGHGIRAAAAGGSGAAPASAPCTISRCCAASARTRLTPTPCCWRRSARTSRRPRSATSRR